MLGTDWTHVLEGIFVLFFSIGLHEFAHAKAADMCGDGTARAKGRLSLNPLDHFDVLGGLMVVFTLVAGFGIGWGKPVPVNPLNFRHLRKDNLIVSLAGIATNLLVATVFGLAIRLGLFSAERDYMLFHLAGSFVVYNLGLAFFNLIPIPPLDGSHILPSFLSHEMGMRYELFAAKWGMLLFLGLLMSPHIIGVDLIDNLIGEPISKACPLLMGLKGMAYYYYPELLAHGLK